ncbi:hypothetical protein [Absidia glauca]|uniref:Uncharacterized protein n=1 Tax=Absidia glauca TaxID=4829 RepID=A0A168RHE3_ABSGL|nr:hypothetical protein [Absidia glauca]
MTTADHHTIEMAKHDQLRKRILEIHGDPSLCPKEKAKQIQANGVNRVEPEPQGTIATNASFGTTPLTNQPTIVMIAGSVVKEME